MSRVPACCGGSCKRSSRGKKGMGKAADALSGQCIFKTRMSVVYGAGCGEAEFRCTDGRCIGYELQCNGVNECSDGSDERDCGNYNIPPSLTSNTPPTRTGAHVYTHTCSSTLRLSHHVTARSIHAIQAQYSLCVHETKRSNSQNFIFNVRSPADWPSNIIRLNTMVLALITRKQFRVFKF